MVNRRFNQLSLGALLLLTAPLYARADADSALNFGSVAMDIPAVMHRRLKPLTDYLSSELKRPITLRLAPDLPTAARDVAKGRIDITYLTPVAYLRAHREGRARLVVKTVTRGKSSFQLMLVARRDSPINSVRDLVGKSFAFGDRAAILQRAAVVNAGIELDEFGSYRFIGHYDNIVRGVLSGDFDAGILKDTSAYQSTDKGLKIIYASPHLPPYNIVVNSRISDKLYEQIRTAFLDLDAKNPEHRKIIKALDPNYDGFAPTSDAEYDIVRKLVKPFE